MENDYSININTNEYTIEIDKEPDIIIELNEQGPPGSSGNGIDHIEVIEETQSYTKYRIVYTDQEAGYYDYIVYNGEKGDKGDTGDKGDKGDTGDKGDKGDTGEPGTTNYNELQNKPIFSTGLTDTSGTITVTDYNKLVKNTATGSNSISLGSVSDAKGDYSIAIGSFAGTDKNYGVAIGTGARATNSYAIQIGVGTNPTSNTLSIGFDNNNNYRLLDGTTGLIPDTRLSTNIARSSDIPTTASDIGALPDTTTINDLTTKSQQNAINSGANTTNIGQIATNTQAISNEVLNRQSADNNLQSQIDALVVASDVFDIVGTYAELQAYDISTVPVNDIIKVLVDSTHNNAATYYRCVENNNVKSWSYIGEEGAYYTKSEADSRFVEQATTINGQALSNNITLDAEDVGALPDTTTIGNGTLTIQKNGSTIDTFGANDTGNTTVNITVPTDTSDLTNNAGYITGIDSNDVATALGYTPYNATNPNGYITSSALTPYALSADLAIVATTGDYNDLIDKPTLGTMAAESVSDYTKTSNLATVATSGSYNDLSDKPTIPSKTYMCTTNTAQDISGRKTFLGEKAIYFKQKSSSNKLGFTLYDNNGKEVGGLEFRPNTINGASVLTLNAPASTGSTAVGTTLVGFRYWPDANIIAPKPTTTGNYYIPLQFKNGSTTVTSSNVGVVDISTLIPTIATSVSASSTNDETVGAKLFYDAVGNIETLLNNINSGSST